jgi:hypothetical protein
LLILVAADLPAERIRFNLTEIRLKLRRAATQQYVDALLV